MSQPFDSYQASYGDVVQGSIDFSGLPHSFFLEAKADLVAEIIARRLPGRRDLAALDIGCGVGAQHPYIRGLFGSLSGVDISAACVAKARAANPWVDYAAYDGSRLPYEAAAFDFALTVCVVHHVPPAQWTGFMAEMARVVRPGGLVAVIEHNPLNPATRIAVARCEFDHDAVLLRSATAEKLMRGAGLSRIESTFFLTMPSARPWARKIERALGRLPLGAQYMTVGEV